MSKPVPHDEVEDVLSSIRRLVSETKRPMAGLRNDAPAPQTPQPEAAEEESRFVLTPALRVAEDPAPMAPTDDAPAPLRLGDVALHTELPGESTEHEPQAPLAQPDEDVVEDVVEDDAGADRTSAHTDVTHTDPADFAAAFFDEEGGAPARETSDTVASDEDGFTDDEAQDEPAEEAFEDDTFDDETLSDAAFDDGPVEEDAPFADASAEAVAVQMQHGDSDAAPTSEPAAADGPRLTSKIAALGTAIKAIQQDFEPDGSDQAADLSPVDVAAMAWEDDVELDGRGAPIEEPQAEATHDPDADVDADAGEDQLLDEAALRALVSEIVRSELQGVLGERITRNVRKLVRREIHRALTAQEME
ncbi:hypothetical protein KDD17_09695 [Sulfitobacter albidus]|uniref:Uncharacterized protein n=1 Tax=Sulfitobacter albidus TaxID=2829501 RepID=A0A975PNQ8_9RHOB|nr:hypothetical protein [Sulfitobacter albidus]QUJ78093.1 hypothetical protein KDD17_09695 [Sulfitobacter albidus]